MYKLLKKSQLWYFDLVIALSLFLVILVFSFRYLTSSYIFDSSSNILSEADRVSSKIMTQGIPENWTNENVVSIGLLTDNVLNITKVDYFYNLSIDNYLNLKSLFGIKSDFIVFFTNRTNDIINFTETGYIGMPGKSQFNIQGEERIDLERYMTYRHNGISEIIAIRVILWN